MISLEPLFHRGISCISFRGTIHASVIQIIKTIPGRLYSGSNRCWYVPYHGDAEFENIAKLFKDVCTVTVTAKNFSSTEKPITLASTATLPKNYVELLTRLNYSPATIKSYYICFTQFLQYLHPRLIEQVEEKDIHDYLSHLVKDRKASLSSQNQAINAIKVYLEKVKKQDRKCYTVERPRKSWQLPVVLSEEEMRRLMESVRNLKHRCILFLLYSSGLRMSELLALQWQDVDEERRVIHVRQGKGQKDHITLLSITALQALTQYRKIYKSVCWVFEGPSNTPSPYSSRSVNAII